MPVLGGNLILAAGVVAATTIAHPGPSDVPALSDDVGEGTLNTASPEVEVKDESMFESSVKIPSSINTGASRGRNRQLQQNTSEEGLEKEVSSQELAPQKETSHEHNEVESTVNDTELENSNVPSSDEVSILDGSFGDAQQVSQEKTPLSRESAEASGVQEVSALLPPSADEGKAYFDNSPKEDLNGGNSAIPLAAADAGGIANIDSINEAVGQGADSGEESVCADNYDNEDTNTVVSVVSEAEYVSLASDSENIQPLNNNPLDDNDLSSIQGRGYLSPVENLESSSNDEGGGSNKVAVMRAEYATKPEDDECKEQQHLDEDGDDDPILDELAFNKNLAKENYEAVSAEYNKALIRQESLQSAKDSSERLLERARDYYTEALSRSEVSRESVELIKKTYNNSLKERDRLEAEVSRLQNWLVDAQTDLNEAEAELESEKAKSHILGHAEVGWVDWSKVAKRDWEKIVEARLFFLINEYRANSGLAKLAMEDLFNDQALQWAREQADFIKLTHDTLETGEISDGRYIAYWTENLAYTGKRTDPVVVADNLFAQWKESEAHNANMLSSRSTHIGLGVYLNPHNSLVFAVSRTFMTTESGNEYAYFELTEYGTNTPLLNTEYVKGKQEPQMGYPILSPLNRHAVCKEKLPILPEALLLADNDKEIEAAEHIVRELQSEAKKAMSDIIEVKKELAYSEDLLADSAIRLARAKVDLDSSDSELSHALIELEMANKRLSVVVTEFEESQELSRSLQNALHQAKTELEEAEALFKEFSEA